MSTSFFVLGDQLSTEVSPWPTLARDTVIVMIESDGLLSQARHRTRIALYLSAMRQFAEHVRTLGFTVDYRHTSSFTAGLEEHRRTFKPDAIAMNAPRGRHARRLFHRLGVTQLPDPFFLSDVGEIAARPRPYATMEAFQRDQRRRLNLLMDGAEPVGGQWNYDSANRKPLPKDGGTWPTPWSHPLKEQERSLVSSLADHYIGEEALAFWPRNRSQALDQLADAIERIIPQFGPHEDAASADNWHLAHSRLSPALNMGLLHPLEVVTRVDAAYRDGSIPLESAEGFIRQVAGWREWVYVLHHLRPDSYPESNYFSATAAVPDSWRTLAAHEMRCIDGVLAHLRGYGWNHHIERLMILANAATLAGIHPGELARWMTGIYVDGAEWVMEANVVGMGTFADGGQTATKPYIGGGNYVAKMTNYCQGCRFKPTERTGEMACPLTTLYWDFLIRNEQQLAKNHRVAPQRRAALQRPDRDGIMQRAPEAISVVLSRTSPS